MEWERDMERERKVVTRVMEGERERRVGKNIYRRGDRGREGEEREGGRGRARDT